MIKALLIDVEAKQIRHVELPEGSGDKQNEAIHKLVGCEIFSHVRLADNLSLWVDDEGLLQERTKGFLLPTSGGQPIMGNGLITGMDFQGEIVDVEAKPEMIEMAIRFIDYESHKQVPIPDMQVYSVGEDGKWKEQDAIPISPRRSGR